MKQILLAFCLLLAIHARAEDKKISLWNGKISVVPQAGINVTVLSGMEQEARLGNFWGAGVRLGKKFHVHTGVDVITLRVHAKLDTANAAASQFQQIKSTYLALPVMIGFSPVDRKILKLRFFAGGVYMLNMTGKIEDYVSPEPPGFNTGMWSARAGAGLSLWRIELQTSLDVGLSEYFSRGSDARLRSVQLGLGFRF